MPEDMHVQELLSQFNPLKGGFALGLDAKIKIASKILELVDLGIPISDETVSEAIIFLESHNQQYSGE